MSPTRASLDAPREPLSSLPLSHNADAQTQQTSGFLGDLYKRLSPPSLPSFLRNPFGQSPRSNRAFLPDTTNLPVKHAWDREKRVGVSRKGKKRTVWKRYETRGNTSGSQEDKENQRLESADSDHHDGAFASPKKVLKKVCVGQNAASITRSQRLAVAASYDRRKSGLPHKLRVLKVDDDAQADATTNDVDASSIGEVHEALPADDDAAFEAGAAGQDLSEKDDSSSSSPDTEFAEHTKDSPESPRSQAPDAELRTSEEGDSEMSDVAIPPQAEQVAFSMSAAVSQPTVDQQETLEELEPKLELSEPVNMDSDVLNHREEHEGEIEAAASLDTSESDLIAGPMPSPSGVDPTCPAKDHEMYDSYDHADNEEKSENSQVEDSGPTADDGECADFTACLEDPTVVGDQYIGTLELKGLRLPSKSEFTDEDVSAAEDEGPNVLDEDPELFEFLDEKTIRPKKQLQLHSDDQQSETRETRATRQRPGSESHKVPAVEETTTVIVDFNDDENVLTDFISRAKASKAARIAKRTSDTHKRDSDVVKRALASPRKPSEDVDLSPQSEKLPETEVEKDSSAPLVEVNDDIDDLADPNVHTEAKELTLAGRRSTRRTATPNHREEPDAPNSVSIRRPGAVILRRTELQELANQTRANTRRNKGAAIPAKALLVKLRALSPEDVLDDSTEAIEQRRTVQWNDELVSFFNEDKPRKDFSQAIGDKRSDAEPSSVLRSRGRRGNPSGATSEMLANPKLATAESQAEQNDNTETVAAKDSEPEKKVPKRRQLPKPTAHNIARTQSAEQESTAGSTTEINAHSSGGPATRRNVLSRTRTSARR